MTVAVCRISLILVALLSNLLGMGSIVSAHKHFCGTHSRSAEELADVQQKIEREKVKRSSIVCTQCIVIDTHIYVFLPTDGSEDGFGTQAKIDEQMDVIIEKYAVTPFTFNVLSTQFFKDDPLSDYFRTPDELPNDGKPLTLARKYRQGNYATMNLYIGGIKEEFAFAYFPDAKGLVSHPYDGTFKSTLDCSTV